MNYELLTLEKLLIATSEIESIDNLKIDRELAEEVSRIKYVWRTEPCSLSDTNILQTYVRQHQRSLTAIGEQLRNRAQRNTTAYHYLEDLHVFIIEQFPDILDKKITISNYCLSGTRAVLKKSLPRLEDYCKTMEMPDNLTRALFESLYEWLERSEDQRIPYYRLQFFRTFIEVFDDLSNTNSESIKKITNFINRVCHINYNSPAVYEAIKDFIISETASKPDIITQIDFLWACHVHYKHLPVRQDVYYKPDNRLMARSLSDWIRRHISCKENEMHQISDEAMLDASSESTTKIMTSLSIEELAVFIRLTIEVGIIKIRNNGLSALARLMSHNVRTLTKGIYDEYKPETFYKYYYSISMVTIQSVQSILKRMLRKIGEVEVLVKKGKAIPSAQRK